MEGRGSGEGGGWSARGALSQRPGISTHFSFAPGTAPVASATPALTSSTVSDFSFGAVFSLGDVSVTVDAYRIDIDDRIVLSENLTATNVRQWRLLSPAL